MLMFEDNLCTTVDSILELLGHKPRVVREHYDAQRSNRGLTPQRPQRIDLSQAPQSKSSSKSGAAKLGSCSELDRVMSQV